MIKKSTDRQEDLKKQSGPAAGSGPDGRSAGGSGFWVPWASFCTTGQFRALGKGYIRHCGPTAAVNVIRTLQSYAAASGGTGKAPEAEKRTPGAPSAEPAAPARTFSAVLARREQERLKREQEAREAERLFLVCAQIGARTRIYWNTEIMGRFGGTSNFLTGVFLRRCLRAAGLLSLRPEVRFHIRITPDAVEEALGRGAIVYLQVYRHPRYQNHHMLCYACRRRDGDRQFLLADGWTPRPVWAGEEEIGHGHFLTIRVEN